MGLPKIDLPLFELEIPSTGKKVKYRPFTVKEEKILLIAQESKDIDQIILAIKQIINNCVHDVDADKLATFDIEYMLINIRSKSVNNLIEFKIRDPETKQEIELSVDLDEVKVKKDAAHSKLVRIDDNNIIVMRYPSINEVQQLLKSNTPETVLEIMISCIDSIESNGAVYKTDEYSKDELVDFVNNLTTSTVNSLQKFFDTIPVLRFEKKYINKNGDEKTFAVEGMETFFL